MPPIFICRAAIICSIMLTSTINARSDEYMTLTDTAYCVGVVGDAVQQFRKMLGANDPLLLNAQFNLNRLVAIVNGAVKQQKIDSDSVNSLIRVGHQDADLCETSTDKCSSDAAKRAEDKDFDLHKNEVMQNNCLFPTEAVCKRVEKCS